MNCSLTQTAHTTARTILHEGDLAIDATAGNGHDTTFLANAVGQTGHVYAFDIQPAALAATRQRLENSNLAARTTLVLASHEQMPSHLPPPWKGNIATIFFNLGYLPGSDRLLITTASTTLPALTAATTLLKIGGLLSILVYPHHPGGKEEATAVLRWLRHGMNHQSEFLWTLHGLPNSPQTPWLATGLRQS
ncbi:MAG: methyltransferase domain-containing protein [Puniceicoccales bacterium]|jgi:predicted methyltransferase|nr:methyltransferase domain-containing protein [Puniceicoccales bacterium]